MTSYVLKRLGVAAFIIYVVVTLSFFMVRLMPGNAIQYLEDQLEAAGGLSPAEIQAKIQAIYGLEPKSALWRQYFQYIWDALHGNLGTSITDPGMKVTSILAGALPWTVFTVSVALIISFVIGIAIGTVMAAFRSGWIAKLFTMVSSFTSAIPNYVIALVFIYILADQHTVFPAEGAYGIGISVGFSWPFLSSVAYHAILPISTYIFVGFGAWALSMKGSVVTTLGCDYVRAAESWGLSRRRVTQSYIGRNAMLPMVTNLALSVGFFVGASVFVEYYFTYPGVGYYLINSVDSRDYSVMMGCFILITLSVVFANLVVDFIYPLVDPRIVSPAGRRRVFSASSGRGRSGSSAGPAVRTPLLLAPSGMPLDDGVDTGTASGEKSR